MVPSVERMLTIWSNGSVLLNTMAAMPVYGMVKHFFSRIKKTLRFNLGIQHWGLKAY